MDEDDDLDVLNDEDLDDELYGEEPVAKKTAEITNLHKDEKPDSTSDGKKIVQPMDDEHKILELFNLLSEPYKSEFMSFVEAFAAYADVEINKPDIRNIPKWSGKKKDGSALSWLNKHYGHLINPSDKELCFIFRQDVINHDPTLVSGVSREANKQGKDGGDFLPTRSNKTRQKAKIAKPSLIRFVNAVQRQEYRDACID